MDIKNYLTKLLAGVKPAKVKAPDGEVQGGERLLPGVFPKWLKLCFGAYMAEAEAFRARREADGMRVRDIKAMKPDKVSVDDQTFVDQYDLANERFDVAKRAFWLGVKESFPASLRARGGIALRKDWQVVALPEPEPKPRAFPPELGIMLSLAALAGGCSGDCAHCHLKH